MSKTQVAIATKDCVSRIVLRMQEELRINTKEIK